MQEKFKIMDEYSKNINWCRLDSICYKLVKSSLIITLTIIAWWEVYELLSHTFFEV